jgi:hypothetical protein
MVAHYAVFGHSGTRENFSTQRVPIGVTLVLLASCLRMFNNDDAVMDAFKNKASLNRFLNVLDNTNSDNVKRVKRMREIYHGGDEYTDHSIGMPKVNRGMLHGVYSLPRDFSEVTRSNAVFNSRNVERTRLSEVLEKVSKNGGGVVLGIFCRSVPGVLSLSSGGHRSVPHTVRSGSESRFLGLGGLGTYMGLRPLSGRVEFMNQVRKALKLRRKVPRPSSVRVPTKFKFVSKSGPSLKVTLKMTPSIRELLLARNTRPNNRPHSAQ